MAEVRFGSGDRIDAHLRRCGRSVHFRHLGAHARLLRGAMHLMQRVDEQLAARRSTTALAQALGKRVPGLFIAQRGAQRRAGSVFVGGRELLGRSHQASQAEAFLVFGGDLQGVMERHRLQGAREKRLRAQICAVRVQAPVGVLAEVM
ncbi:MAG: hypothetical protein HY270_13355 [Deltaproteobacteria bacterium]|nr:hypothetical protein [Deltaproteobacteria bacterium]